MRELLMIQAEHKFCDNDLVGLKDDYKGQVGLKEGFNYISTYKIKNVILTIESCTRTYA
jgi:hypothetical protein